MLISTIDWSDEIAKAGISLVGTAILGGILGLLWVTSRRRREGRVAAQEQLYNTYGQWYAVWKEWSAELDATREPGKKVDHPKLVPQPTIARLVSAASHVEADFEALLIRVSAERRLSENQQHRLGQFRQGWQRLRESIEDRERLAWRVVPSTRENTPQEDIDQYIVFKGLSVEVARIIGSGWRVRPSLTRARKALVSITSWRVHGGNKEHWYVKQNRKPDDNSPSMRAAKRLDHFF